MPSVRAQFEHCTIVNIILHSLLSTTLTLIHRVCIHVPIFYASAKTFLINCSRCISKRKENVENIITRFEPFSPLVNTKISRFSVPFLKSKNIFNTIFIRKRLHSTQQKPKVERRKKGTKNMNDDIKFYIFDIFQFYKKAAKGVKKLQTLNKLEISTFTVS